MSRFLIALDPGKSSGLSLIDITDIENASVVWSGEYDQFETCKSIEDMLSSDEHEYEVVCESFIITAQTHKKTQSTWSLEILGAVRYFCQKYGASFVLQTPQAAKSFSNNDRLRSVGFWHKGGEGHANDSLRHAVLYLVEKKGWQPKGLLS